MPLKFYDELKTYAMDTLKPRGVEPCMLQSGKRCRWFVEKISADNTVNEEIVCGCGAATGEYGRVPLHRARKCPIQQGILSDTTEFKNSPLTPPQPPG